MEDWPNVHEAKDVPIGSIVRILDRVTDGAIGTGTVVEKSTADISCRLTVRRFGKLTAYGRGYRYEVVNLSMLTPEQLEEVGEVSVNV